MSPDFLVALAQVLLTGNTLWILAQSATYVPRITSMSMALAFIPLTVGLLLLAAPISAARSAAQGSRQPRSPGATRHPRGTRTLRATLAPDTNTSTSRVYAGYSQRPVYAIIFFSCVDGLANVADRGQPAQLQVLQGPVRHGVPQVVRGDLCQRFFPVPVRVA
ncbi:hypothetical protein LCGC14_2517750 [marine sediment metagenome]|uniref:Uncharacterized protein n=1 Tax=marine sediment metagenome TaxID=412755 RepID=A0A0F9BKC1_9ZZZZ